MSINQLVFGHQATVVIQNPITGANLVLTNMTKFDSKQRTMKETSKPLNSPPIYAHTPDGWDGTIDYDRVDSSIDAFFAQMEAAYWNNTLTYSGTITLTIQELNYTYTRGLYTGATLTLADGGTLTSQGKISQKITFEAAQRLQIQ